MGGQALFKVLTLSAVFAASTAKSEEILRTEPSRGGQEIVITNQNLALVTDTRRATLPAGRFDLLWDGVAPSVRTETWSLSGPPEVRWLGIESAVPRSSDGDSPEWLRSLIGKRVRVVRPGGASVEAEVLEVHGPTPDRMLFREGPELVYGEPHASLVATGDAPRERRPAGLYLKLSHSKPGERDLTSRYLVANLTWTADYAVSLAPDEKSGSLEGWFVIDNATGSELVAKRLRLLAGVLRLAGEPASRALAAARVGAEEIAPSSAASESRVYEVQSPGTLKIGRTTFPLADRVSVNVAKRYVVRPSFWLARNADPESAAVSVQYRVATAPLARALPAGVVRVYSERGSFFTGESRIAHVPEGTDFDIETSEAFDLAARHRQTAFAQIGPRETESTYETTITSRKKEDVTVLIRENLPGDWTVVESSVSAARRDAFTAEFALPVPAGSTARLTYRVRVRLAG